MKCLVPNELILSCNFHHKMINLLNHKTLILILTSRIKIVSYFSHFQMMMIVVMRRIEVNLNYKNSRQDSR